jgi:hypothetical protein
LYGGFVTPDVVVLVVVPQSLVLAAWAAGENQTPPTAVNAVRVVATVRFLSDIGLLLLSQSWIALHRRHTACDAHAFNLDILGGTTRREQGTFG